MPVADHSQINAVRALFGERFGGPHSLWRAPGRFNVIGEHVDYCGGLVLPAALEQAVLVAVAHDTSGLLRVDSDFGAAEITLGSFQRHGDWRDYVTGMAYALAEAGFEQALAGASLVIRSAVPVGLGVSSSAALEVAVGLALTDGAVSGVRLAQIAQRAENHFVGFDCGIMDQLASACGVAGAALEIDCERLAIRPVLLPEDACFIITDCGVRHQLTGSEYSDRRRDCEQAGAILGVRQLCDVTDPSDLAPLSGDMLKRARHVVSEIARTRRAVEVLEAGDLETLGQLMNASNASLDQDMEVGIDATRDLARLAQSIPGVLGARMMGGGFGGSVIALTRRADGLKAQAAIVAAWAQTIGNEPLSIIARAGDGAGAVQ